MLPIRGVVGPVPRAFAAAAALAGLLACGGSAEPTPDRPAETADPEPETGLVGRLRWTGEPSTPAGTRPSVCPESSGRVPVVGPDGGLPGALVLVPMAPAPPAPTELTLRAAGCQYSFSAALAAPGATLEVRNEDDILHTFHVRADNGRSLQNLVVPPGGPPLRWTLPTRGRLRVTSDDLGWMEAVIVLAPGGARVQSDAEGRFELPDLAAGAWTVEIHHPRFDPDVHAVTVPPDGPASLYRDYSD